MLPPSSGTGEFITAASKVIRFVRLGCTNRPFYHIVVSHVKDEQHDPVIEQLGAYDPLPNKYNQKLVSLNLERIRHWIGNGAEVSRPVAQLLGLSGLLPIHPTSYIQAWRNREEALKKEALEKEAEEKSASEEAN